MTRPSGAAHPSSRRSLELRSAQPIDGSASAASARPSGRKRLLKLPVILIGRREIAPAETRRAAVRYDRAFPGKRRLAVSPVHGARQIDAERKNPFGAKARVDRHETDEALQQQPRADEQHDGKCELRDDEPAAEPSRPAARQTTSAARLQSCLTIGLRRLAMPGTPPQVCTRES